jgi:hypothetical protein
VCNYIANRLEPFAQHPYIELEDWAHFVNLKESEVAQAESSKGKILWEKNVHSHHMGSSAYEGKLAQWEVEDSQLTALGIPNP